MSRENVEIVARLFECVSARDMKSIRHFFAAEGEWRPILTAGGDLERRVYRGPAGIEEYVADLDEMFEDTQLHIETLDAVGAHRVLFTGRVTARGRLSGVPIDQRIWASYEVRGGQVVAGTAYRSRDEALEAAGLSE